MAASRIRSQRNFVTSKLNAATQNAIGNALKRLLDPSRGDDESESKLTIKEMFAVCRDREKYSSIDGALIGRLVDENMPKECAMLAQADKLETNFQVP